MKFPNLLIAPLVLSILGSCSFNDIPSSAKASFVMPNLRKDDRPLATYACLNVWGPDGRWNSQIKTMSREDRALSVEFEVPYLWVGRQYTFRILGFNTDPSQGSSAYTCPIGAPSAQINELGILENKLITKEITQVIVSAKAGLSSGDVCGLDLASSGLYSCYNPSFLSTHSSTAKLVDGTPIKRVNSSNPDFKVWMDESQTKMLRPNGLWQNTTHWQRSLKATGREFETAYFSGFSQIGGRACPKSVYENKDNQTGGNCLYFTQKLFETTLSTQNSNTEGEDFLESWMGNNTTNGSAPSYFEGNIKGCKDIGMRLPTLFEFRLSSDATPGNVPMDIQPTFDTTDGIPTEAGTPNYLTATASTFGASYFHMVQNSVATGTIPISLESNTNGKLICVLPSNEN